MIESRLWKISEQLVADGKPRHSMSQYKRRIALKKTDEGLGRKRLGRRSVIANAMVRRFWHLTSVVDQSDSSPRARECYRQWRIARTGELEVDKVPDAVARDASLIEVRRESADTESRSESDSASRKNKAWRRQWDWYHGESQHDAERLLFCVQTYYAAAIRWIVLAELTQRRAPTGSGLTELMDAIDDCSTAEALQRLQDDSAFSESRWVGFQIPIFDWYWDCLPRPLPPELIDFAKCAVQCVGTGPCYGHSGASTDRPTDRFHALYQDLIPGVVRRSLGEHYTPEWLVELLLDRVAGDREPAERILDPSCGSGAFLMQALRRRKQLAPGAPPMHPGRRVWSVVGIDRDPAAVFAARANYVLAIADWLASSTRLEQVPVILADSILGESVGGDDGDANAFTLQALGKFDRVVGNPPWVSWETLTPDYRRKTEALWFRYGLFADEGMDAILGKGKKDLSMLVSLVASDRYLRAGGVLGFLITNSVFLNHGAGRGFRRFRISDAESEALKLLSVDDFSELEPFDTATTNTCAFVWQKGAPTAYPVPYHAWTRPSQKTDDLDTRHDARLPERELHCNLLVAQPSVQADPQSSWIRAPSSSVHRLMRMLRPSAYRAHEGINSGGANGVYWLRLCEEIEWSEALRSGSLLHVENRAELGKISVPTRSMCIESQYVFPLVRGTQLKRWSYSTDTLILMVQDVKSRKGISENELQSNAPRTLKYLRGFETTLERRAAYRRFYHRRGNGSKPDSPTAPFYSMFNVGTYTEAPFKVAWHRMKAPIGAAVLSSFAGKLLLPQETHAFVPCDSQSEASFIAGILNSSDFNWAAAASGQQGNKSFGSPHLLERVFVPQYDESIGRHRELADCAERLQTRRAQDDNHGATSEMEMNVNEIANDVLRDCAGD